MQLLAREKFLNFLLESNEIKLNTKSRNKLFYFSNVHEYLIESPTSGKSYLKPDKDTFNTEVSRLSDYLKLQDALVKSSNLNDPRKLEKDLNQLSIYNLFSEEISKGWFSDIFKKLLEFGVEEPTAREIENMYPSISKFSNDAKNEFTKFSQDLINYAIAKIDILIHYSTLGEASPE
jgi:hypothetical protein